MLLCVCFQGWQYDTRWPMSFRCLSNRKAMSDQSLNSAPAWLQSIIQDSKGNAERLCLKTNQTKPTKQKTSTVSQLSNWDLCMVSFQYSWMEESIGKNVNNGALDRLWMTLISNGMRFVRVMRNRNCYMQLSTSILYVNKKSSFFFRFRVQWT